MHVHIIRNMNGAVDQAFVTDEDWRGEEEFRKRLKAIGWNLEVLYTKG